jgi:hypothetical protein
VSPRGHGQIRRSQAVITWGPGALIDLPTSSAIIGGLEGWPKLELLQEIVDPRLTRKLTLMTGVQNPPLFAPPPDQSAPGATTLGIDVWRFPRWMVVQEQGGENQRERSRRLVHRQALDERGRFDARQVVPTRFVRACPRGHIEDLNWHWYVHGSEDGCRRQLWLDERGTGGDLADLVVRCECGQSKSMHLAAEVELKPLGTCPGRRPWLGAHATEKCELPSRLLIRTAANAYFPQVMSTLSLPEHGSDVQKAVTELWDDLVIVDTAADLAFIKKKPQGASRLAAYDDAAVVEAISNVRHGSADERPVKLVSSTHCSPCPKGTATMSRSTTTSTRADYPTRCGAARS